MTLSILESLPLIPCLFEAISALATVGLSFGITPDTFRVPSRLILIAFMFIGRVGGLYDHLRDHVRVQRFNAENSREKISVG